MAQVTVNGITVYSPQPTGDAGLAIDNDLRELSARMPLSSGPIAQYSITAEINAKVVGATDVFLLPENYLWSVDSIVIACKTISGTGAAPLMKFGISSNTNLFAQIEIDATTTFDRVTLNNIDADVLSPTNTLSAGIVTASTYTSHTVLVTYNITGMDNS